MVVAIFFALVITGLSVTMIEMGIASRRTQARLDNSLFALEAAETGLIRAEQELPTQSDPDHDGIGTVSGTYAGSRYVVTATQDPKVTDRYTLLAQVWHGQNTRRIQTCVRLVPGSAWQFGIFARDLMSFSSSGAGTDAYDSRLGSYKSQAVNHDSGGWYAQSGGSIASNNKIDLSSSVMIRGNANPGPTGTISMSSGAVVTGTTTQLPQPMDVPAPPYADFLTASTVNDNGNWIAKGKVNYDPVTKVLSAGSGTTLTLTGKTYFFTQIKLSGGANLVIDNGPVKIYVTDDASLSGGAIVNKTALPYNMQFFQWPYALPVGYTPKYNTASLSGGTDAAFVVYAPSTSIQISGNGGIAGAIVAGSLYMKGGAQIHYDLALSDQMAKGNMTLQRLYWRDLDPPQR
jgi:hypothetical protein